MGSAFAVCILHKIGEEGGVVLVFLLFLSEILFLLKNFGNYFGNLVFIGVYTTKHFPFQIVKFGSYQELLQVYSGPESSNSFAQLPEFFCYRLMLKSLIRKKNIAQQTSIKSFSSGEFLSLPFIYFSCTWTKPGQRLHSLAVFS